mgnify:CR=1 FL=1
MYLSECLLAHCYFVEFNGGKVEDKVEGDIDDLAKLVPDEGNSDKAPDKLLDGKTREEIKLGISHASTLISCFRTVFESH